MTAICALLLDMDGTLVDTEPVHIEAHRRFLATVGIVPTEAELLGNIGKGDEQFYRDLMALHGRAGDADAWVAAKDQVVGDLYRHQGVPVRAGVHALLDHASEWGLTCVVVTSSGRELARTALESSGLAGRLPMRVCYEDTVEHKPRPDPYLLAASRLSMPPAACLVIEDSASGVASGCAAGCLVVAVQGHIPAAALRRAGALRVLERVDEILPVQALAIQLRTSK